MGKASRRKRERREEASSFIDRLRNGGAIVPENMRLVRGNGINKISVALSDLIEPYVAHDLTIEEFRSIVGVGTFAWNLAVRPDLMSRDRPRRTPEDGVVNETELFVDDLIDKLRERKLQLFPDDQRLIMDTQVYTQPDGSFYLMAAATEVE